MTERYLSSALRTGNPDQPVRETVAFDRGQRGEERVVGLAPLLEAMRSPVWAVFAEGAVKPGIHGEFALEGAAAAHAAVESRVNRGKAVLHP